MWPLLLLMSGFGWLAGTLGLEARYYTPSSGGWLVLLILASMPATIAAFLYWLRPRYVPMLSATCSSLFTATAGVLLLLVLQWVAGAVSNGRTRVGGRVGILWLILVAIGTAYSWAHSDHLGEQWIGQVFGVGLCEEMVKLLPLAILVHGDAHRRMGLHSFLSVGFCSGIGFGITEALFFYSPWGQNDVLGCGDNFIRWFACIPSHGLWTVASSAVLWKLGDRLAMAESFWGKLGVVLLAALGMAFLHGTYNTLCSIGWMVAMLGDVASVFVVAGMVRRLTAAEEDPARAPEQAMLHRLYRPTGISSALGAATLLGVLALAGTTSMSGLLAQLLPAEQQVYVTGWTAEASGPEDAEGTVRVEVRFDEARESFVGRIENRGEAMLNGLTVICSDEIGNSERFERRQLAPGASTMLDPMTEWAFLPGESIRVRWDGETTGVVFDLP